MKTVWKFELSAKDHQTISLPKGAKPLTVQVQNDEPMLWCLCDPNEVVCEDRFFRLSGTGHPITDEDIDYIGTFQLYGGGFVGHVFEVKFKL